MFSVELKTANEMRIKYCSSAVCSSDLRVGALFVALMPTPNTALAVDLGCAVDDNGSIVVDGTKRTTVQGVWAVGDVTTMRANMSASITDGVLADTDCNLDLLARASPHPTRPNLSPLTPRMPAHNTEAR